MRAVSLEGTGVIVLLREKENTPNLLQRFQQPENGRRPGKWDPRLHGVGAQILRSLKVRRMRVLSQPKQIPSMVGFDLEVVEYVAPGSERKLKAVGP